VLEDELADSLRQLVGRAMRKNSLKCIDVDMDIELKFMCCAEDEREEVRTLFADPDSGLIWAVVGRPGAEGFLKLFDLKGTLLKRHAIGNSRTSIIQLHKNITACHGRVVNMTQLKDDGRLVKIEASVAAAEMDDVDVLYSKNKARFQLKVNKLGDLYLYKVTVVVGKTEQPKTRVSLNLNKMSVSSAKRSTASKTDVKKIYHEKLCQLTGTQFPVAFDASADGSVLAVAGRERDGVLLYRTGVSEPSCECDMPCCRPRDLCFFSISERFGKFCSIFLFISLRNFF
jgi:hypothetical protein